MSHVPGGGEVILEMRIISENRLARRSVRARYGPCIRARRNLLSAADREDFAHELRIPIHEHVRLRDFILPIGGEIANHLKANANTVCD